MLTDFNSKWTIMNIFDHYISLIEEYGSKLCDVGKIDIDKKEFLKMIKKFRSSIFAGIEDLGTKKMYEIDCINKEIKNDLSILKENMLDEAVDLGNLEIEFLEFNKNK